MFSEVCCELEASVVSVMAEALILKLLGRACRVNTASSSQQGVGAMAGTFAVTPLCKLVPGYGGRRTRERGGCPP